MTQTYCLDESRKICERLVRAITGEELSISEIYERQLNAKSDISKEKSRRALELGEDVEIELESGGHTSRTRNLPGATNPRREDPGCRHLCHVVQLLVGPPMGT